MTLFVHRELLDKYPLYLILTMIVLKFSASCKSRNMAGFNRDLSETDHPAIEKIKNSDSSPLKLVEISKIDPDFLSRYQPVSMKIYQFRGRSFALFNLSSDTEDDFVNSGKITHTEVMFCDQVEWSKCQDSPVFSFSSDFYAHLIPLENTKSSFTRVCVRSDRSKENKTICSGWYQHKHGAYVYQPEADVGELIAHLEVLHNDTLSLKYQCDLIFDVYRDYLSSKNFDTASHTYILASNTLELGIDHCYLLMESDISEKLFGQVKKMSTPGGRSLSLSEVSENNVYGIEYSVFQNILMAFGALALIKPVASTLWGKYSRNLGSETYHSVLKRYGPKSLLLGALIGEAAFAGMNIAYQSQNSESPFPLVSSLILGVIASEFYVMLTHKPLENRVHNLHEQLKSMQQEMERLKTVTQNSESIENLLQKQRSMINQDMEYKKWHRIENRHKSLHKGLSVAGSILGGLEIINILTGHKVDEKFSLAASGGNRIDEINGEVLRLTNKIKGSKIEIFEKFNFTLWKN